MDVIITLAVAFIGLIGVGILIAKRKSRLFGSMQFTSQTVMHGFASGDRKAAIEEVQYVQEDELVEEAGADGIKFPEDSDS